ncbi:CDP-glycerol glycerophosphotransferase family protein [Bacillus smithii]|uniref:CDP-glycerol glycerophosphotransferase family protein n=1 Tax=Bacillus smithii TaxID=1479 RepID=UPI003D1F2FD8
MKKIGLFCSTIFHFYIYENIIKNISNNYVFISPDLKDKKENKKLMNFINNKGYQLFKEDEIIIGSSSIDILLSPYWRPSFLLYPSNIKMVRLMYGYAKDDWNYADWNRYYDLILTYGEYAQHKLKKFNNSVAVGNPRIYGIEQKLKNEPIQDIKGRYFLDFKKKEKLTILYAPTWGDLSSFAYVRQYIEHLSEEFNFIVKAHHLFSVKDDVKFNQLIQDFKIFYCDEQTDLFSLIHVSDLMISDYSGAIFDGILSGINTVLVNGKLSNTLEKETHLEGIVRNKLKVLNTNSFTKLLQDIQDVFKNTKYRNNIYQLQKELFINVNTTENIFKDIQRALQSLNNKSSDNQKSQYNKRELLIKLLESNNKNIVICGGGEFGRSVLSFCKANKGNVSLIVDNYCEESSIDNVPVLKMNDLLCLSTEKIKSNFYLIATKNGAEYFQNKLEQMDLREVEDFYLL